MLKNEIALSSDFFKEINIDDINKYVDSDNPSVILFYNFEIEKIDENKDYNVREASEDFMYVIERCHYLFKDKWNYYKINYNIAKTSLFCPPKRSIPTCWFYRNRIKVAEVYNNIMEDREIINFFNTVR